MIEILEKLMVEEILLNKSSHLAIDLTLGLSKVLLHWNKGVDYITIGVIETMIAYIDISICKGEEEKKTLKEIATIIANIWAKPNSSVDMISAAMSTIRQVSYAYECANKENVNEIRYLTTQHVFETMSINIARIMYLSGIDITRLFRLYMGYKVLRVFRTEHAKNYVKMWGDDEDSIYLLDLLDSYEKITNEEIYKLLSEQYKSIVEKTCDWKGYSS